jgi:hypothetical protein
MPNCPKCGASVSEDAVVCTYCGTVLQPHASLATSRPQPSSPPPSQTKSSTWSQPYEQARDTTRRDAMLGIISAVISLFILPEIFGSTAIILGAYVWKKKQGNLGLAILIVGILFMLIGVYFTALLLVDFLPQYTIALL